jgi:hypothetical protein
MTDWLFAGVLLLGLGALAAALDAAEGARRRPAPARSTASARGYALPRGTRVPTGGPPG